MRNYLYISDAKVDSYIGQLGNKERKKIAADLGVNVGVMQAKLGTEWATEQNRITRLEVVEKRLLKEKPVGSIGSGKPWIEGMADVVPATFQDEGSNLAKADFIVPIPLSPDKAKAQELNRTLTLAEELSQLIGVDVRSALSLNRPIAKRALNVTADLFERRYSEALSCRGMKPSPARILLVDDVCTHGSTFAVAARTIRRRYPDCDIIACSAGQMTVREAFAQPSRLLEPE